MPVRRDGAVEAAVEWMPGWKDGAVVGVGERALGADKGFMKVGEGVR